MARFKQSLLQFTINAKIYYKYGDYYGPGNQSIKINKCIHEKLGPAARIRVD